MTPACLCPPLSGHSELCRVNIAGEPVFLSKAGVSGFAECGCAFGFTGQVRRPCAAHTDCAAGLHRLGTTVHDGRATDVCVACGCYTPDC